ncbi:MAG: hypothetical protein JWM59_13 [Verrucomicrobiales bacterium]|nr:hypothetical protein [Verrucomicrobiales bacterium]
MCDWIFRASTGTGRKRVFKKLGKRAPPEGRKSGLSGHGTGAGFPPEGGSRAPAGPARFSWTLNPSCKKWTLHSGPERRARGAGPFWESRSPEALPPVSRAAADRARTCFSLHRGGHAAWALRSARLRPAGSGDSQGAGTGLPDANRRHSGAPGPVSREQGGRAVRRRGRIWRRCPVRRMLPGAVGDAAGCCRMFPLVATKSRTPRGHIWQQLATTGNNWTQVDTARAQAALGKTPAVLFPASPGPASAGGRRRGRGAETSFRGGT